MLKSLVTGSLLIFSFSAFTQSKSTIGFSLGANYPLENNYKVGLQQGVQASIRLSNKFALAPSIEHQQVKSAFINYSETQRSFDLFSFSFLTKYYLNNHLL